jgi:RNA polymerase sigma factor (sigma-70 family)
MAESFLNPGLPLHDVLTAIRAGDEDAVRKFVDYYEPRLRRVLRVTRVFRLLQSQIDSQDLVQSVFARVIADIRSNRVEFAEWEGVEAYLNKVGRNRLHDAIRRVRAAKRDARRAAPGGVEMLADVAQAGPSPSEIAAVREEVARIEACASPSELEIIKDRADGIGWQELAGARGIDPEALRKRIERVRRRIRDTLEKTGPGDGGE